MAMLFVVWIGGGFAAGPEPDGDFVLTEPGVYSEPSPAPVIDSSGERLPSVALTGPAGEAVRIDDHRDGPIVVNVWFSTCPPCAAELGDFAAIHDEVGDRVRFVGVDPRDTREEMEAFAAARGVDYELLLDDGSWVVDAGVIVYPTTLFVDADGVIVRQTGVLDADQLRGHLAELFGV